MSNDNLTEQDFLRDKTTTVFESRHTVTDVTTGEILTDEHLISNRTSSEPDFIKVYYRTMLAANNIGEIPLDFLLALSTQIGYANGRGAVLFFSNKTTRRELADYCDISDNMVQKYILRCIEKGILFRIKDDKGKVVKGSYEVNPWMIAKGRWNQIRELQASFHFVAGKWTRIEDLEQPKEEPEPEQQIAADQEPAV